MGGFSAWRALVVATVVVTFALSTAAQIPPARVITCASEATQRQHCPADTSAGVALERSTGQGVCLLGRTWGYDQEGVWVSDGCGGEFVLGQTAPATTAAPPEPAPPVAPQPKQPSPRVESWGEFEPGGGFLIGRGSAGELSISAYALVRYINQMPGEQTFTDHLGNERPVDGRQDFFPNRAMIFFKGWLGTERLVYTLFIWTVNTTDQKNIFGSIGYQFGRRFSLYGDINGLPGTRSLQGSHPYWLGHDGVMADEFFRPYFSNGIWAHAGLGRTVHPVEGQLAIMERALANPELKHRHIDLSWDETAKYIVASPDAIKAVADLITRYPDRLLFGTDEVAPTDQQKYLKVYDLYATLFAALPPAVSDKLRKGNYERLFDEARRRVRAWEAANVK